MPKPKLTKTQLEDLSRMKASTFYGSGGYAYVEIDNRGWKPYTTRPVQALLDKGIITIPRGENRRFYGRLESMEAYIVYLNPVAWEYPFKYDSDKSLSQVGDKIVQNVKINQQEDARRLKERQDYDNLTEAEVYRQLFGAEGKVRTMSGKPHTPRKLVKDKNITPKEAAKRMKLEAESFFAKKPTVFAMLEYLKYNPSNGVKGIEALPPGEYRVKRGEASKSKLYYGRELKELKEGDLISFVAIDRLHYDTNVAFNVPIYEYENNKIEYYDYDLRPTKRGQGRTKDAYFNNALFDSKTSELPLRDIPLDWVRISGLGDASFYGHKFMQGFRKWISNAQNKKIVNDEYNRRFGKKLNAEEGTFYDEGRTAANAVFMPDMKDRESFGLMDAEYAFTFGLSPDELVSEIDNNSKRYTQFSWGWGQEWDKLNMDVILNPETFNGEWVGQKPFQDYMPDISDFNSAMILVGGLLVGLLGYNKVIDSKKAETFNASEACSEDTDCPEGKVCVNGKCMTICVDDGDCASWQECRDDLHPTEKVCGEDKTDSDENPFANLINNGDSNVGQPNDAPTQEDESYSTTTKAVFGVGIVGAIVIGIKVLGGMQDKER
jgi:hypothetical protein